MLICVRDSLKKSQPEKEQLSSYPMYVLPLSANEVISKVINKTIFADACMQVHTCYENYYSAVGIQ